MATTVLETYGVIRADGNLEMNQKLTVPPGRVKVRVESVEAPGVELAKRFSELTATWKERTGFSSKIKTKVEHPAFRAIIAMGQEAVPLILADLEKNGGFGFLALEEITGADPAPEKSHVNIDEWVAAWIAWGRAQG